MNINTSAIIIAYFPDKILLNESIHILTQQVGKVFVINNTPEHKLKLDCCEVINLNDNLGIAKAQNVGLELSIMQGFEYSIIFDQDSNVPLGMIDSMLSKLKTVSAHKIACIGPRAFDIYENKTMVSKVMKESSLGGDITEVKQIMASGQFIPLNVLADIGFMNESLFIDVVDHEWCWRARDKGYKVLVDESSIMRHRLADSRETFLGFTYKIGAPIRLYYQFRNILRLMFINYVPSYWKVRNIFSLFFKLAIFTFLGPNRKERLVYMGKGILHSILGKSGRYE